MALILLLLESFLLSRVSSEVQCLDLTNSSSANDLGNFSTIILGRTCSSTTSGDIKTVDELLWTVTTTGLSDAMQITMFPTGVVAPYVEDDALKFHFVQDIEGFEAGVEIVIPSGQVSTFRIIENNAIAYLNLTNPVTIDIASNTLDLFLFSNNILTIQGDANTIELTVDSARTTFQNLMFNVITARMKGSTSGSIAGNQATLLIEGELKSLEGVVNVLDISINGEGCENVDVIANMHSCGKTDDIVEVPRTACTASTSISTHSCSL